MTRAMPVLTRRCSQATTPTEPTADKHPTAPTNETHSPDTINGTDVIIINMMGTTNILRELDIPR